jgi:plastocyanin
MGGNRKKVAVLGVIALLASLFVAAAPMPAGAAATDYKIRVGGFLVKRAGGAPADSMRFYTPRLRVHRGDTVKFKIRGFHTATLTPAGVGLKRWVRRNDSGVGERWSLIARDRDDGKGHLKFNIRAAFQNQQGCGSGANPCTYKGNGVVNSGFLRPTPSFTVKINAPAGSRFGFICLIHPGMRKKVRVVGRGTRATKQDRIDRYRERQLDEDAANAAALHRRLSRTRSRHRTPSGEVVWDAYSGYDGDGFALMAMYPLKLKIRKGQSVRWHFRQRYEDHTVTFPSKRALNVYQSTTGPYCDNGAGSDQPPENQGPPFCNPPTELEFDLVPRLWQNRGNRTHRRRDYDSSGVEGANFHPGRDPYRLKFTRVSNREGYNYICLLHPFMRGSVRVRPRR